MRDATAVVGAALVLVAAFGAAAAPATAGSASANAATDHCSYPITVTDATGTEVTIEERPQRMVALAPSAAQILWSIDADNRVVGMPVDYHTGYLDGTHGKIDVVSDQGQPVTEQIIKAGPDLVFAPNVITNETVRNLRDTGLTVYRFEAAESLEDVYERIELYGRLAGNYDEAGRVSADMQGQVDAIRSAVDGEERPRVYFDLGFGYTTGTDSFIGQMIDSAGGDNVAAGELNSSFAVLSDEVLAEKDPERIVVSGEDAEISKSTALNESTAVEEGNVVRVNSNFMNQNGPKNLEPLKRIASVFHPDAYESIDFGAVETPRPATCGAATPATATPDGDGSTATAEPTATPADTEEQSMAETTEASDDGGDVTPAATTGGSGPGFTAATGVVALLAAALVGRRRG